MMVYQGETFCLHASAAEADLASLARSFITFGVSESHCATVFRTYRDSIDGGQ